MGRPPLAVGTYGEIWVSDGDTPYKARVRYRDQDGVVRTVARFGQTKAAAKTALRAALVERAHHAHVGINPDTTVRQLAADWLVEIDADPNKAARTKDHYRDAVRRYVIPHLGAIRLREARTGLVDVTLVRLTELHGPSAAKTARAVLNGMFNLAVRHSALAVSPVRETRPITVKAKSARALTVTEADYVTSTLRESAQASVLDLPDLVDFMLATGCRIGEVCAIRDRLNVDGKPIVDLTAGTVEINATAIRVKGQGMVIQERPKTAAGWRVLALPSYSTAMLERRARELRFRSPEKVVFSSPFARTVRDPVSAAANLREVLDGIDCGVCAGTGHVLDKAGKSVRCDKGPFSWVTSHVFRKTVATRMDEAGCSAREIADQLGHSQPSMTLDVYMGRKVVSARAAAILER